MNLVEKYLGEGKSEKHWSKMSEPEKKKCYRYAIKTKDVKDTFEDFSKSMSNSTFNVKTGKPIEIG